jgi:c(7)-type cytochrome triheme protein
MGLERRCAGLVVVVAWLWTGPLAAEEDAHGFDHRAHEARLAGQSPLACTKCHVSVGPKAKLGLPGHKHQPCNEAGCHPRAWDPPIEERTFETLCLGCHRVAGTGSRAHLVVAYPPFVIQPEHLTRFSHRTHQSGPECTTCHVAPGTRTQASLGAGHALCASCHEERATPRMAECTSCHKDAKDPALAGRASRGADPFRVQGGFSHAAHEKHVPQGKDCRLCHENVTGAETGRPVPLPTMRQCAEACHDGKTAFDALGTACARCHKDTGTPSAPVAMLPALYSHATHAPRLATPGDCAACHSVDREARVQPVLLGKNHQPCNSSGCHRDDFFAREPKICGACHADARPWIKAQGTAVSRAHAGAASEFGRELGHKNHVGDAPTNAVCTPCHAEPDRAGVALPGHELCVRCHGGTTRPGMSECVACHRLGFAPERFTRDAYAWTVSASFSHAGHRADPRAKGAETPCVLCHPAVGGTMAARDIRPPAMASCDPCHDGKQAFKTTGFECFRCHAGQARTSK